MKIGLLSPFLPEKDGIAIYSNNILIGLGGKRKDIVTIGRKGSKADYIIDFRSFSLKKDLENIIKKENLDAIHIQYVAPFFSKILNLNLLSALSLPIPVIVTLHEVHYLIRNLKDSILESIERQIIKKSNLVIIHTPKQKEFLEKKYKAHNIRYIYHGLNLFKTHKRKGNNLLCFGMISKNKGVEYLIKAMDYLPDCKLTITGNFVDKKIEKEIKSQLKFSKAEIKTEFGWIDEHKKSQYYNNADLVVLPHVWAPYQSGILHNAVAFGLPVVAAKTGALWEMVDLFRFGEVVKPKSPKALAEGIKEVLNNYSRYKKGIEEYRKVANWEKIAKDHLKVYREGIK
ncbi:MAG: glycosyltransferase family 4 protein [Nanoarchaeota archaeon]|nr:glycosyltransferase family 4 protein [Nanoarchaeota archaeon]MBU1005598.1 glycosyltransferase family 4 protein [Nanoarchaeota archaeon]MBU1945984.1 glycosyltransferase family 4 protein [Nanoarchaeota archaeon]